MALFSQPRAGTIVGNTLARIPGTFTTADAYKLNPMHSKGTIRKMLTRAVRSGYVTRVKRGQYRVKVSVDKTPWQTFQVHIRTTQTRSYKPINEFNLDVSSTMTGRMRKMGDGYGKITQDQEDDIVERVLLPVIQDATLELLSQENVSLDPDSVIWSYEGTNRADQFHKDYYRFWRIENTWFNTKYAHRKYINNTSREIPQEEIDDV